MKHINLAFFSLALILLFPDTPLKAQEFTDVCVDAEIYYSLADALKEKEKVKKLDISMQKIGQLSPSIKDLENLECLDLSFNRFSTLPPEFAQLKNLSYLNLTGTRFMAKVPAVLKDLPNLKILDLRDHPEWSRATFEEAKKMLPHVKVLTP